MENVLIVYATHQGHTQRVAERVAEALRASGHGATLSRVDVAPSPRAFDAVILGAPIEGGRFAPPVVAFAKEHATDLGRLPSAFFSVSLTAAHADDASRNTVDGYLRHFQMETAWRPDVIASFAGALLYSRYGLLHRALMRYVAARGGLATDVRQDHVYTDWDAVSGFVEAFVHLLQRASAGDGLSSARPAST